jgi:hypothetical protein
MRVYFMMSPHGGCFSRNYFHEAAARTNAN